MTEQLKQARELIAGLSTELTASEARVSCLETEKAAGMARRDEVLDTLIDHGLIAPEKRAATAEGYSFETVAGSLVEQVKAASLAVGITGTPEADRTAEEKQATATESGMTEVDDKYLTDLGVR